MTFSIYGVYIEVCRHTCHITCSRKVGYNIGMWKWCLLWAIRWLVMVIPRDGFQRTTPFEQCVVFFISIIYLLHDFHISRTIDMGDKLRVY